MFFSISKIGGFAAIPSNFIALVGLLGLVLLVTRWQKSALSLLSVSVIMLAIAGFSPIGNILLLTIAERFPPWQADGRAPDGIIVLGGAIDSDVSVARGTVELDASAERILEMLRLARRYPQARIVFSGGSGNFIEESIPEAPIAGDLLAEFGVPRDRIVLETGSRTTSENAEGVRALVQPKPGERWLLVTSAFHMPRSIGVFRKAGFDVEAYPVDWRTRGLGDARRPFGRLSIGLSRVDVAMHEWMGLVGYWLTGRTNDLLPSVQPKR